MRPAIRSLPRRRQRGVATLIVVMVLFFIISLVAAYTNRNLIFEQRTSANQYRSTQALEAAEAGVEWALALLNHQHINATCQTSTSPTDTSFRQRYLVTDPVTGKLTPRLKPSGESRVPSCVLNGAAWDCSCPDDGDPVLTPPGGSGVFPAFRVRFEQIDPVSAPPSKPGVIRIHSVGCTRLDDQCLNFSSQGQTNEGRAAITTLVALTGGVASPPNAALTARGTIDFGAAAAAAYNTNPAGTGITLQAGGAINTAALVIRTIPGSPSAGSVFELDPALALAPAAWVDELGGAHTFSSSDRMFASIFGMVPDSFRQQPAAVVLGCGAGACSAETVRTAIALNPGRPLWVQGGLAIDSAGDIGSSAAPVLLVVEGDLTFPVSATIYGMVYLRTPVWATAGTGGRVQGAAVAEGTVGGAGTPTFVHDRELLTRLRASSGSFVRVSGSWKDFK